MAKKQYKDDLKVKALAIADKLGAAEAARATGIPAGTIRSWLSRLPGEPKSSEPKKPTLNPSKVAAIKEPKKPTKKKPKKKHGDNKKLKEAQEEVMERAIEEAGEYVATRLKGLATNLYCLAEKAVGKVDIAISDQDELPKGKNREFHDRDGAAWVRSLVGVMSQSIDKAQLLSGKPTVRPEVNKKYVYEITQRIINDQESIDLAEQLLRRASGINPSTLCLHGDGGEMDTIQSPLDIKPETG